MYIHEYIIYIYQSCKCVRVQLAAAAIFNYLLLSFSLCTPAIVRPHTVHVLVVRHPRPRGDRSPPPQHPTSHINIYNKHALLGCFYIFCTYNVRHTGVFVYTLQRDRGCSWYVYTR